MPKRKAIESVLIIGSGPIVIGQGCEFDYSGTQACRALRQDGVRVILVNSNPATIMTDPDLADATYIEPLTPRMLEKIIAQEKPSAILPTVGGQTGLNLALQLDEQGILARYGMEMIGASPTAIEKAENREKFQKAMERIGLQCPFGKAICSVEEGLEFAKQVGLPFIVRPSYTLGGFGGGVAYTMEEAQSVLEGALAASPSNQALVEESVLGWKEYEMEVMRDCEDNAVVVCSIENLDAMGVHTGDSITVAPAQTLSDQEWQRLRNYALQIIREIGVNTGGCNVQFAINPQNGEVRVIEMNPRVSRSSALASKATGFPIAKIAARLAIGWTLDELSNDITRKTPACFEPALDYVVTKIPRFNFEKFPTTDNHLTTQMKSIGEVMAIGRNFKESFQKALRSLECGWVGLNDLVLPPCAQERDALLRQELRHPTEQRILYVAQAMRLGFSDGDLHSLTGIDPWFLAQIRQLVQEEVQIENSNWCQVSPTMWRKWKHWGFADARIAQLTQRSEAEISAQRRSVNVRPVFCKVDTCAGEFEAATPYFYSTYEDEGDASTPSGSAKRAVILGAGPNRIGQGIEFDYCCVHAAMALGEAQWEAVMINCNPETVSTDYDISNRLYFEPVTLEDVQEVLHHEQADGVVVQLGGQTPLKLVNSLHAAGIPILGTGADVIDRAESRERFADLVGRLGLKQPQNFSVKTLAEAEQAVAKLGLPIILRPSYVLGGRAMEVVHSSKQLAGFFYEASKIAPGAPVLIEAFLQDAVEVDIDLICDGKRAVIGGMMEHIEHAGVHSGDSACTLPPHTLSAEIQTQIGRQAQALALELGVVGLMNAQFAVTNKNIWIIEVNPRASRTVPFVSKAMGIPLAKWAVWCMLGRPLPPELGSSKPLNAFSVKETVFPFVKLPGADLTLGPEMRSTGEVMGRGNNFAEAFYKAQQGAGNALLQGEWVFFGLKDADKAVASSTVKQFQALGFSILATPGTTGAFEAAGIRNITQTHLEHGQKGSLFEWMQGGKLALVVNTTSSARSKLAPDHLRRMLLMHQLPYCSTLEAAQALANAVEGLAKGRHQYASLENSFTCQPLT